MPNVYASAVTMLSIVVVNFTLSITSYAGLIVPFVIII